jgi:hypothetical protein
MPFDRRTIHHQALLTMAGPTGEILSLLVFADGGYGIARDGRPLDGLYWPQTALDDCIYKLLWLAGKSEKFSR